MADLEHGYTLPHPASFRQGVVSFLGFVGGLGGATTDCSWAEIFKNLWFGKWGMGWGWREVGVKWA